MIYLQSEYIEKYQYERCSKYDREHNFDVTLGSVVPSRKLRWICRKNSNDLVRQVEIPGKSTILSCDKFIFVARHNFHVASEITLHHYRKTLSYCKRCIFSLPVKYCDILQHFLLHSSGIL